MDLGKLNINCLMVGCKTLFWSVALSASTVGLDSESPRAPKAFRNVVSLKQTKKYFHVKK